MAETGVGAGGCGRAWQASAWQGPHAAISGSRYHLAILRTRPLRLERQDRNGLHHDLCHEPRVGVKSFPFSSDLGQAV